MRREPAFLIGRHRQGFGRLILSMGIPRIFTLWLGLAVLGLNLHAFVYYPVGPNVLRWNVDSGQAHPNVVNPATKAVRYYIASDAYSSANREKEINAIRACFDQWQSITGSSLRFEFAGFAPAGIDIKMAQRSFEY